MIRAVAIPTRGIRPGEVRVPCVRCRQLGPAVKFPSGQKLPTPGDMKAVIGKYEEWGWHADALGPCCPGCAMRVN